jgi:hypothetical protein
MSPFCFLNGLTTYVLSGTDLIVNGVLTVNENFQSDSSSTLPLDRGRTPRYSAPLFDIWMPKWFHFRCGDPPRRRTDMRATDWTRGFLVLGLGGLLIAGCAASVFKKDETPGQHFDREMKVFAENCAKAKLKPNDTACDILKLKSADPLATKEGRFAHSIKIPNPIPEDSGYKPGMTSQEYFDHLCKTEAGEFIYQTVENVEGLYMMRLREQASDDELSHLYALEDPYGYSVGGDKHPEEHFVQPGRKKRCQEPFFEHLMVVA